MNIYHFLLKSCGVIFLKPVSLFIVITLYCEMSKKKVSPQNRFWAIENESIILFPNSSLSVNLCLRSCVSFNLKKKVSRTSRYFVAAVQISHKILWKILYWIFCYKMARNRKNQITLKDRLRKKLRSPLPKAKLIKTISSEIFHGKLFWSNNRITFSPENLNWNE